MSPNLCSRSPASAVRVRGWPSSLSLTTVPLASGQQAILDTNDPAGVLRSITLDGNPLDLSNPFFQSLGTNGRSCSSCHVASSAWTITPDELHTRFDKTRGLDPIFTTNDGSNSPNADVSTLKARQTAFSMLLTKGLIRIGLPIPAGAEFTLVDVDDPYGYASASELSLFRRPIPSTNLRFLTAVMWDGRESFAPMGTTPILSSASPQDNALALFNDLKHQANDATTTHAQGAPTVRRRRGSHCEFRAQPRDGPAEASSRRRARREGCPGWTGVCRHAVFLRHDQRRARGGYERAAVRSGRDDALQRLGRLQESTSGPRSLEVRSSSARSPSRSRGWAG